MLIIGKRGRYYYIILSFFLIFLCLQILSLPDMAYGAKWQWVQNREDIEELRKKIKETDERINDIENQLRELPRSFQAAVEEIRKIKKKLEERLLNEREKTSNAIDLLSKRLDTLERDLAKNLADMRNAQNLLREEVSKEIGALEERRSQEVRGLLEKSRKEREAEINALKGELLKQSEGLKQDLKDYKVSIRGLFDNFREGITNNLEERDKSIDSSFSTILKSLQEKDEKIKSIMAILEKNGEERKRDLAFLKSTIVENIEGVRKENLSQISTLSKAIEGQGKEIGSLKVSLKKSSDASIARDKEISNTIKKMVADAAKERKTDLASLETTITSSIDGIRKENLSQISSLSKVVEKQGREIIALKGSLSAVAEESIEGDKKISNSLGKVVDDFRKERKEELGLLESSILKSIEGVNKQYLTIISKLKADLEKRDQEILFLRNRADDLEQRLKVINNRSTLMEKRFSGLPFVTSVYFRPGSTEPITFAPLKGLIELLKKDDSSIIRIAGWSDNRGDFNRSMDIASKRAMSVYRFLLRNGIDKERLTGIQIGRDLNPDTEVARRVDVFIYKPPSLTMETRNLPPHTKQRLKEKKGEDRGVRPYDTLYSKAKDALDNKDYAQALEGFRSFLKLYPDTEVSDNAWYWMGEIYYAQGDYEKAMEKFKEVINRYPDGDKISAALLKQALSLYYLGDKTKARGLLEEVRDKYKGTEVSTVAVKKLNELYGKGKGMTNN